MDVGDLPAVGRIDVVGAGRRGADEVRERAQQDEVAGPRPRLVGEQHEVGVERRVVEEVERGPALLLRHPVGGHLAVEVLRAVHVPGVAEILVVAGRAGERERVVAADRVLDDLAQRVHVGVVVLRVQPDRGVRRPHQGPGDLRVEPALHARVELVGVEGEEVRALPAGHVDDLDVLALAHLVGQRRGLVDPEVEPRLGERRGQLRLLARARHRPLELDDERGRGPVAVDHPAARRGDHDVGLRARAELLPRTGRSVRPEQPDRPRVTVGEAAIGEHARRGVGRGAERQRVRAEHAELGELAAVRVDDREPVVGPHADAGRPARPDPPRLGREVDGLEAGCEQHRATPAASQRPCRPAP